MEVLILLIFLSVVLVGGAVGLFAFTIREQTFDHADRLALLPLRDAEISRHPNADATPARSSTAITPKGGGTDGENELPQ